MYQLILSKKQKNHTSKITLRIVSPISNLLYDPISKNPNTSIFGACTTFTHVLTGIPVPSNKRSKFGAFSIQIFLNGLSVTTKLLRLFEQISISRAPTGKLKGKFNRDMLSSLLQQISTLFKSLPDMMVLDKVRSIRLLKQGLISLVLGNHDPCNFNDRSDLHMRRDVGS